VFFEWDARKAIINIAKHNVSFIEAIAIFYDRDALDDRDVLHSTHESRRLRVGRAAAGRVLTVSYTSRRSGNGEAIRIISARPANREEELGYTGVQD